MSAEEDLYDEFGNYIGPDTGIDDVWIESEDDQPSYD